MKLNRQFVAAIGILCGVLIAFSVTYYALLLPFGGKPAEKPTRKVAENASETTNRVAVAEKTDGDGSRRTRGSSGKRRRAAPGVRLVLADEFEGMNAADRKLAEAVQAAMDSDDHNKIIAASAKALESANPRVRLEAVEALGWCGKDALSELTGMLADSDDEVRDIAINNWECALSELDNPKLRFSAALAVMGTITQSDALESISGQFGTAAQEYIDEVDDESAQNGRRVEIVQQLLDIIEGPKPECAEKAKEAFNDLTGHEWMGVEEAEKYLADPDDYEPPEDK